MKILVCVFGFWFLMFNLCLAEEFIYNSKNKRDPFLPLVGSITASKPKGPADIRTIDDVDLNGIVYDEKGGSMVIINGALLKEKAQAGLLTIEKVEPKRVFLLIEGVRYEVPLGVKKGGE